MNGLLLLIVVIVIYAAAYALYGRFLEKAFGLNKLRLTPAHTERDGVDFVPTNPFVLFGHHFSSIAGAGPIVGPVLAAYFGWAPVVLWLLFGCVFIGAFHDMAAMSLSVRNKGRSIASVIEEFTGYAGRQLFLAFCFAALALVVAIFAGMVADGFVAAPAVATSSILFVAIAPVFGYLVYRKGVPLFKASLVAVPLCFFFVWLGTAIPLDLQTALGLSEGGARVAWLAALMAYAACASVLPVWSLLQPRDYLSSYLLYAMILFGALGVVFYNPPMELPAFAGFSAPDFGGAAQGIFPFLFITIACGACSGFHSLVASGTSSKQVDNELHIRPVAYGGMLVEGVLGTIALIAVGWLGRDAISAKMAEGMSAPALFAHGLAEFGVKLGVPAEVGAAFVSLAISAFLLTTLDTATRLARFTFQELFAPSKPEAPGAAAAAAAAAPRRQPAIIRALSGKYVATAVCVLLSSWLAMGEGARIWPVFGASNQLLAALTLLVAALWLAGRKRRPLCAALPMFVMLAVSGCGLAQLALRETKPDGNPTLAAVCVVLLILAAVLCVLSLRALFGKRKTNKTHIA
jgi:Carbon starvation protein, predicted membrane protein